MSLSRYCTMNKEKWMIFIQHLWATVGYWQLVKLYRDNHLPGSFFKFTAYALRDKLLMQLANSVHLCAEIAEKHEVGEKARTTLEQIKTVYRKGEADYRALRFEDCGIKPYRDKVLAHPAAIIKELFGKEQYQISLRWETIDQTLEKIKQFADEVEAHHAATWEMSTFKQDVGVETGFRSLMIGLDNGEKYDKLKLSVALKGKPKVYVDWEKNEIVVED